MNEYEWPTELEDEFPSELDIEHPELSPATVSMLSFDTLQSLQRIRDCNQRQRELSRIQFSPQDPEDSELSITAFFTVITVAAVLIFTVVRFFVWLLAT